MTWYVQAYKSYVEYKIGNTKRIYKDLLVNSFWDTFSFLKLFCPEFGIFMKIDFQFYRNEICLTALFTISCKSFETAAIFEVIERYYDAFIIMTLPLTIGSWGIKSKCNFPFSGETKLTLPSPLAKRNSWQESKMNGK